jgi:hypothetical protein
MTSTRIPGCVYAAAWFFLIRKDAQQLSFNSHQGSPAVEAAYPPFRVARGCD